MAVTQTIDKAGSVGLGCRVKFFRAAVMFTDPCPRCGKSAIVTGIVHQEETGRFFQPDGIRFRWLPFLLLGRFGMSTVVTLRNRYRACIDCGLVWNELNPGDLLKILEREGIIAVETKKTERELA
jgi:hypothetical protein